VYAKNDVCRYKLVDLQDLPRLVLLALPLQLFGTFITKALGLKQEQH
jgi:hypothetical protein